MKPIASQPCHEGAGPIAEEFVVVDPGGPKDGAPVGLQNVFVYVESPALPKIDGSSLAPTLLDQVDCRYVPHVVGVCVGQPLVIRTSDPRTMHNVHYAPQQNPARNFGMTSAGQEKTVTFVAPEFVQVKCDVHPWMTARIGVFDTPFFAVTSETGSFEIKGLPPGAYKLIAWHERYGTMVHSIQIDENSPTVTDFEYKPPG